MNIVIVKTLSIFVFVAEFPEPNCSSRMLTADRTRALVCVNCELRVSAISFEFIGPTPFAELFVV